MPIRSGGEWAKRELRQADRADDAFDSCFCLVDVDAHNRLEEALALARGLGIKLLVSNVKFEVWLHWRFDGAPPRTSGELEKALMDKKALAGKGLGQELPNHEFETAARALTRPIPSCGRAAGDRTRPRPCRC